MTQRPGQIPLFLVHDARREPAPSVSGRAGASRYETVAEPEAAELGRALLARLRGDGLTDAQEALLLRAAEAPELDRRAPTPVIDVSETLLTLGRGDDAEVRVSWRRYKGSSPFLDIRRWEREPTSSGGMHPTRQGVTIRARELPRLLRVVVEVARRAVGPAGEDGDE